MSSKADGAYVIEAKAGQQFSIAAIGLRLAEVEVLVLSDDEFAGFNAAFRSFRDSERVQITSRIVLTPEVAVVSWTAPADGTWRFLFDVSHVQSLDIKSAS